MEQSHALVIGEHTVNPGEMKTIHIELPKLYDCSPTMMPLHVVCGKKPGPVLLVTAAIHGDELNGVEIIRRLIKKPSLSRLNGALIALPIVNVYGFLYQSRYLMDRRDLNRCFPGSQTGSIAARIAYLLLSEVASHATHVIDLHTGSLHRSNLPQIRANLSESDNLFLAQAFNAPVTLDLVEPEGSFRHAMRASKKPFLLYEAGEALRFDKFSIRVGVKGIMSVMRALGMLKDKPVALLDSLPIAYSNYWLRAEHSGVILLKKQLGQFVKAGENLATIANPLSGHETSVRAKHSGIVIGKTNLPLVHEGEALFHIGCFEKAEEIAADLAENDAYLYQE